MVEIEGQKILFVCLVDAKKKNTSKLEIHTFKYLSPLNETYGHYKTKGDTKREELEEDIPELKSGLLKKCCP